MSNFVLSSAFILNLHDGPGLGLPLSLRQPPRHLGDKASGGLAVVQPGLPFPGDPCQRITTGRPILLILTEL